MLEKERNDYARRYLFVVLGIMLLQVLFTISPSHQQKLEPVFLWPLAITLLSFAIYQFHRDREWPAGVLPAFCMVGWMYITRLLNGDPYLQLDLHFMLAVLLGFGVCYPIFHRFRGAARLRWFGFFARIIVCVLSAVSCLALYGTFAGIAIQSPFAQLEMSALQGRLFMFSMHPNELACCLSIGFFLAIYAILDSKRLWTKLLWALMALCMWLCVLTTVTRTVMITISIGIGMLAFLLVLRALRKRRLLCKISVSILSLLLAGVVCFGLFNVVTDRLFTAPVEKAQSQAQPQTQLQTQPQQEPIANETQPQQEPIIDETQPILEKRSLIEDMSTFTGRKEIWQAGLQSIKERPITLLIGMTDAEVSRIPVKYTGRVVYHMHNSWLETLLLVGVPGLLLYICLMLRIGFSSVKLFFTESAPVAQRALTIIPAILMVNGLMEIYPSYSGKLMDLLFFTIAGAVVAMATTKDPSTTK